MRRRLSSIPGGFASKEALDPSLVHDLECCSVCPVSCERRAPRRMHFGPIPSFVLGRSCDIDGFFPCPGARIDAYRLDVGALDTVVEKDKASLRDGADILILNKFVKQELADCGLRSQIVSAVEQGIPVLAGLDPSRVGSWNAHCGATSGTSTHRGCRRRHRSYCSADSRLRRLEHDHIAPQSRFGAQTARQSCICAILSDATYH